MYSVLFQEGLVALEIPQGEETSSPWFGRIISSLSSGALRQLYRVFFSWPLRWPLGNLSKFLPVDPPSGRLPLLSITWEVCHKSGLSLTLLLNQGESNQGRKLLKLGDASKDRHHRPIQFPYLPSIVDHTTVVSCKSAFFVILNPYNDTFKT